MDTRLPSVEHANIYRSGYFYRERGKQRRACIGVDKTGTRSTMKVFGRTLSPRHSPDKEAAPEQKLTKASKGLKKDDNSNHMSDLSNSTDGEDMGNTESQDDTSVDHEKFERMLRHKHSKACKAMSVSNRTNDVFW